MAGKRCVSTMNVLQQLQRQDVRVIPRHNNSATSSSKQIGNLQGLISINGKHYNYKNLISKEEAKALSKVKHKDAERDRRGRINSRYDILRTIFPNSVKKHKASLLQESVKRVTELENKVKELKADYHRRSKKWWFPSGKDNLSLGDFEADKGLLKVTFSCEYRLGLVPELTRALQSLKGRVVRAEMANVGGRTKWVLWVQGLNGSEEREILKRAVDLVVGPILYSRR